MDYQGDPWIPRDSLIVYGFSGYADPGGKGAHKLTVLFHLLKRKKKS